MVEQISRRALVLGGGLFIAGCGGGGPQNSVPVILPPSTGLPSPNPTPNPTPGPTPTPVPAGSRILGISPTDRMDDSFDAIVSPMKEARTGNATISFAWDDIETAPGVYDPDPNFPAIANLVYPANGLSLTVVLVGIDTTADRRPADLQSRAYDDPEVIARYRAVQAWLIDQLKDVNIVAFSIGNEIDAALVSDADAWRAWRRLFEAAAPDARAALRDAAIGSKATSNVLNDPVGLIEYGELLKNADASMLTYYPSGVNYDSSVLPAVGQDFDQMLSAYPDLPLRLLECGFTSSAAVGSSEQQQADFVTEVFRAWDANIADIPQLDYFAVHDFSPDGVAFFRDYYGVTDPQFTDWLGSLGLRNWNGDVKLGWNRFVEEAVARGFQ